MIKYAKKEQKSKEAGNALIETGNDEAAFTGAEPKKFKEVYEVKKAQLEAAYSRQQQEIDELKDLCK